MDAERALTVIVGLACVVYGAALLLSRPVRDWAARVNAADRREWDRLFRRWPALRGRAVWRREDSWRGVAPLIGVFAIALGLLMIFLDG